MREPRVVWIMERRKVGTRRWEICWGIWSTASTKVQGYARAMGFTEEGIGWKFRVKPFKEVV